MDFLTFLHFFFSYAQPKANFEVVIRGKIQVPKEACFDASHIKKSQRKTSRKVLRKVETACYKPISVLSHP